MKNKLFAIIALMALCSGLKSQTYHYAPSSIHNPYLSQKGNAGFSIGWGRGASFESLEFQTVYSFMPHLAVMANYFGAPNKTAKNRTEIGTNAYQFEGAIGLYEPLKKGAASLFGGYSIGEFYSHFGGNNVANLKVQRIFIQPGIKYRSRLFQAGLSLKISRLQYSSGNVSYSIEQLYLDQIKNIEKESPILLPELGIQAGMRLKPVTICLNITSVFPNTERYNFNGLNTALSLQVDFGGKAKK